MCLQSTTAPVLEKARVESRTFTFFIPPVIHIGVIKRDIRIVRIEARSASAYSAAAPSTSVPTSTTTTSATAAATSTSSTGRGRSW